VALYRRLALNAIEEIKGRGRMPLLVGGTRLYIKALTAPFSPGPPPDPDLRRTLARAPTEELFSRLAEEDPESAGRLHHQDRRRIIRALEASAAGEPLSAVQAGSRAVPPQYFSRMVVLYRPRDELYARVDARVDAMICGGLLEEVRALAGGGMDATTIASQAHGYKELLPVLAGDLSLADGVALLKRNTRRYVKYQLGWMRQEHDARWVDATGRPDAVAAEIVDLIARWEDRAPRPPPRV
jgi:tRNA dimethylallyltransferase